MCNLRMSEVEVETAKVYSVLFATFGSLAAILNTLAVIVLLIPGRRTRSNRILASLVISDVIVGYVIYPISAYQVGNKDALNNCSIDLARTFIGVLSSETSTLTMCILSIDRYMTLKNLHKYNKYMTMKKINLILALIWLISALTPAIRFIGKNVYLVVLFFFFGVPISISLVNYCIIANIIYKQTKIPIVHSSNASMNETPMQSTSTTAENLQERATKKRYLNLAKQFLLIAALDLICVIPLMLWPILDLINISQNIIDTKKLQEFYIFANLFAGGNSFLNPFVYVWKNTEFKRRIRRLLPQRFFRRIQPKL